MRCRYNAVHYVTILHTILQSQQQNMSDFELTKKTPYLAPTAEIWGVYCEKCGENWRRYNDTALCIMLFYFGYINRSQGTVWLIYPHSPGPRFNIKMTSYQYRKSHCGDKTILRSSYLHNGISYTGKTTSLYWIRAQVASLIFGAKVSNEYPQWSNPKRPG